jgi:hypothetical protein
MDFANFPATSRGRLLRLPRRPRAAPGPRGREAAAACTCGAAARSLGSRPQPAARAWRASAFLGYNVRGHRCPGAKARASGAAPPLSRPATTRRCRAPARCVRPPFAVAFGGPSAGPPPFCPPPCRGAAALRPLFGLRSAPAGSLAPAGVAAPTLLPPLLSLASAPLPPALRWRQVSRVRHPPPRGRGGRR